MNVPPPRSSTLSRLTTLFAVVFCLAFGLCSVGLASGDRLGKSANVLFPFALGTEAICLIGLLTVGAIALFRFIFRKD